MDHDKLSRYMLSSPDLEDLSTPCDILVIFGSLVSNGSKNYQLGSPKK